MRLTPSVFALVALTAACGDSVRSRQPSNPNNSPDSGVSSNRDATTFRPDAFAFDFGPRVDTGVSPDASMAPDAQEPTDVGFPDAVVFPDADPFADAQPFPDAQPFGDAMTFPDATPPADTGVVNPDANVIDAGAADSGVTPVDAGPLMGASAAIASIYAAADGPIQTAINGVTITYLKPATGIERAGFYVQEQQAGPGLFIEVDPATLVPPANVGDLVSFVALEKDVSFGGVTFVSSIINYARQATNQNVAALRQDLSNAADLVTNVAAYESEIASVSMTIASGFALAGPGHSSARVTTAGVPNTPELEIRLSDSVQNVEGLGSGCVVNALSIPVWRFQLKTQLSVYASNDISVASCPAPRVVSAVARGNNRVVVSFDRPLNAATVNASQFVFSGGLTATSAIVSGEVVRVDTTVQNAATQYTLTVGTAITDLRGQSVNPGFRTATFMGGSASAVVRINELNANIANGCDLIELRAITGGSLDGFVLRHRATNLVTFSNLTVQPNQYIVVHLNGGSSNCNPSGAGDEVNATNENPSSAHANNFDTAFDWYSATTGLQRTDTTIALFDASQNIVDAVLCSDAPTGTAARDSEVAATDVAALGEWTTTAGTIPPGGFVDDNFSAHAVLDLDGTGTTPAGTSIQRSDDNDTNHRIGWTDQNTATWGANNPGQVNQ